MMFAREGDTWNAGALSETGILTMTQLGVDLVLDELYQGLDLPPVDDSGTLLSD